MRVNSISCKVQIDGQDAAEYDETVAMDEDPRGRTKKCYIASQEGKPFRFIIDFNQSINRDKQLSFHISADGEVCKKGLLVAGDYKGPKTIAETRIKTPTSNGMYVAKPFRFGRLETVEADDLDISNGIESRAEILKGLGSLKVVVWESVTQKREPAPRTYGALPPVPLEYNSPILEKSLKGRSVPHRTSFGQGSYHVCASYKTKKIEPAMATFEFRYTSEESLKNQLIIPRTEEDEIQEILQEGNTDNLENMSVEDLRRELRRRREEEAANDDLRHKIKREIKVEGQNALERRPLIRDGPVETIDFTGDDD